MNSKKVVQVFYLCFKIEGKLGYQKLKTLNLTNERNIF